MGVTGGALFGSQMVDENATESMSLESTESSGAPPGGALSFTRAASQQPQRQPPRRWWARCAGATPSNWMTTATSRWLCLRRRCVIAILPACAPCCSTFAAKSIWPLSHPPRSPPADPLPVPNPRPHRRSPVPTRTVSRRSSSTARRKTGARCVSAASVVASNPKRDFSHETAAPRGDDLVSYGHRAWADFF